MSEAVDMPTVRDLRAEAREIFDRSISGYSPREIDWLIMAACNCSQVDLISDPDRIVPDDQASRFHSFVQRRSSGEPVQYILGSTEFYGLTLEVNPSVLIPRPETEGLVDLAIEYVRKLPEARILDIGTGSGCIAIALASNIQNLDIVAVDLSADALQVARRNGVLNGVAINWLVADFNRPETFADTDSTIDMIVSNPPYIAAPAYAQLEPEVKDYEPELALTPGGDPLGPYRQLGIIARRFLKPGGLLITEISEECGGEIRCILEEAGLNHVEIQQDLAGRDRYALGRR